MTEDVHSADVLVVGAGLAGVVTSLELLDQGKKVLLVDRDTDAAMGGLAKWAFGGVFLVDSPIQRKRGIDDSPERALRDWTRFAEFDEGDTWPRRWAEHFVHQTDEDVFRYLADKDVHFFPVVHWVERGLEGEGNSVPRFHLVWGTGDWLSKAMVGHLRTHPRAASHLRIFCEHKVDALRVESGKVVGCSGERASDGARVEFRADRTVVATGGIGGSLEKVRRHWHRDWGKPAEHILVGAHRYADGQVHDAAEAVGAKVTHLDRAWSYAAGVHHPKPRKAEHGLSLVPCKSALWMDAQGRRFRPPLVTAFDTRHLVRTVAQQEHPWSWQILNARIAKKEFAISGAESNPAIRDKRLWAFLRSILFGNQALVDEMLNDCVDFVSARSPEELADKMEALNFGLSIDRDTMLADIREYDGQIHAGRKFHNDDQLRRIAHARQYLGDRVRTCAFQAIDDPKAYPLIAIRCFIISRKTLGGIQTDLGSRVLDTSGEPMEGLYAVGEAAGFGGGGVHGHRALEGTFLAGCLLTARRAARAIAKD